MAEHISANIWKPVFAGFWGIFSLVSKWFSKHPPHYKPLALISHHLSDSLVLCTWTQCMSVLWLLIRLSEVTVCGFFVVKKIASSFIQELDLNKIFKTVLCLMLCVFWGVFLVFFWKLRVIHTTFFVNSCPQTFWCDTVVVTFWSSSR